MFIQVKRWLSAVVLPVQVQRRARPSAAKPVAVLQATPIRWQRVIQSGQLPINTGFRWTNSAAGTTSKMILSIQDKRWSSSKAAQQLLPALQRQMVPTRSHRGILFGGSQISSASRRINLSNGTIFKITLFTQDKQLG